MRYFLLILIVYLFNSSNIYADYVEKYKGIAYNKKNEIAYVEQHTVTFHDNSEIKNSSTVYMSPKGVKIATLDSNYASSLSAPSYKFKDLRHKSGHGIQYLDNKLQMIKYKKDGSKKTKFVKKNANNQLIVGGQGLPYYIKQNFNQLKNKQNISIKFLTPGNLKYYNFLLNYIGPNKAGNIVLEVKISNLFLRLFAPKLKLQYDPKTKRLIEYDGLSNLSDDNNKIQSVKIKYQY